MRPNQIRLSTLMFTLLLAACATPVSTTIKPTEANIAKYSSLSALEVVTALEKNVNDAKEAGMPFLAPHYYREASQVLSESQSGLSNKPKDQLTQLAAKGDAILDKGRTVMSIVQYRFAKELELKSELDKLNTAKLLPKEYAKATADFSTLIEIVERERSDNIDKSKEALFKTLQELEVKAVQEGALRESEVINNESKTKNAEKQVPATYAEALRVFQDAKTRIAAAPHDRELVVHLGTQALFAARHAQQLNNRVDELQAQFKGTSGGSPSVGLGVGGVTSAARVSTQVGGGGASAAEKGAIEKIVLQEEDRLLSISTALGQKDLRDLALDKQVQEIKRAAAEAALQARNEAGVSATKNLEAKLQAANDATRKAMTQLADKDQQLAALAAQLAEKDAQIATLNEKITKLESAAAAKPAAVKAKTGKAIKK